MTVKELRDALKDFEDDVDVMTKKDRDFRNCWICKQRNTGYIRIFWCGFALYIAYRRVCGK